jgi:hypothetical protein
MTDRINALVDPVQPSSPRPVLDRMAIDSSCDQLRH